MKPGKSFASTGVLPSALARSMTRRVVSSRRREPANDLDELHHRHGIHEVHPDHLSSARFVLRARSR